MVTVIEFLTRLGDSILELPRVFFELIEMGDPLAIISFLMGLLLMAISFGVLGFLVLGALGRGLGIVSPTPYHNPRDSPPRH